MPTFAKAARRPIRSHSTGVVEDRARFERRLDGEDNAEDRPGARLRPKNSLGPKRFGIEIVAKFGQGEPITYCRYYRSERARQAGLDHYNRRINLSARHLGYKEDHYSAKAI